MFDENLYNILSFVVVEYSFLVVMYYFFLHVCGRSRLFFFFKRGERS